MVCSSVEVISIRLLVREKLEKSRVLRGCGRHAHNLDNGRRDECGLATRGQADYPG